MRTLPCVARLGRLPPLRRTAPPAPILRRIFETSAANPAPIDIPKLIVSPGSVHHNSLESFLKYAERTGLAPSTTVYVGTHYEYTVKDALARLGFVITRTGRKADAGIDLTGHWALSCLREPLPVIIQCKARKVSCNPKHIRELEGSFQGIPPDWRRKDVLGLLATTQNPSDGVREALMKSRRPLGFLKVSRTGTVEQLIWNHTARERALEGVGVTIRHSPRALPSEAAGWELEGKTKSRRGGKQAYEMFDDIGMKKEIQLTWMGTPIYLEIHISAQEMLELESIPIREPGAGVKSARRKATTKAKGGTVSKAKKATKASAEKPTAKSSLKRGPGRPPGSKNKKTDSSAVEEASRKRGRPKGSKSKLKISA